MTNAPKLVFRGNPRDIAAECTGFAIAEGVSLIAGMGVMAFADQVAPSLTNRVTRALGKVIEPVLDKIEWSKQNLCKLEECQIDYRKSREERAQETAKVLLMFGAAWYAAMEAKLFTRNTANKLMHLPHEKEIPFWQFVVHPVRSYQQCPNAFRILAADESIHYGSLLMMNTSLAKYTDDSIRATSNMLERTGLVTKEKAHELATYGMVWEAPNVLGMLAGMGAIGYNHSKR